MRLGGTISNSTSATNYSGIAVTLFRLGVAFGERLGYFDIFWSVKLSSYLPMCKLFHDFEAKSNEENKSYWLLHKVVYPTDPLETSIDTLLLGESLVTRLFPIAIIQTSLKEKHRLAHFKKHFSVSEETLKKCTIPNYACSTSTTTSVGTSS
jgi:hypothetical protein